MEGKILESRRTVNNRINRYTGYQYGSAVRKLETAAPEVRPYNPARHEEQEHPRVKVLETSSLPISVK